MSNNTPTPLPPSAVDHPIHSLLAARRSSRAFSVKAVDQQSLQLLFEAARWTPSLSNEQPWNFLVTTQTKRESYDRLLHCLIEFNRHWAQHAPILILMTTNLNFASNGKRNSHAWYDSGQAAANLTFQATALGLIVHQMAGFDSDKVRQEFAIPLDQEPTVVIALGYPGDPNTLPEKLQQRELSARTRKTQDQFVRFL
jgi:nitroreductase